MSKDKAWLIKKVQNLESETSQDFPHEQMIEKEEALYLINQLNESSKIKLDDVIARLDGLEKDNRLSWISKILHNFKMEYDDSKYQSGYEQGKVDGIAELQEKYTLAKKPVVPQFVADWIEYCKKRIWDVASVLSLENMDKFPSKKDIQIYCTNHADTLARAFLYGYEVEKEPVWVVRTGENWYFKKFEEIDGNPIQGVGVGSIRLATKIFDEEKAEAIALLVGGEVEEVTG